MTGSWEGLLASVLGCLEEDPGLHEGRHVSLCLLHPMHGLLCQLLLEHRNGGGHCVPDRLHISKNEIF